MLEWFEKACLEFEAQCDGFQNVIGRAPTLEAMKHMRAAAVTIVTIARQWVLTKLRKGRRTSQSKFILIRQDVSSLWAIRNKKDFMYDNVRTERRKLSFPTSPTARDFQIFASVLLMKYEGPSMETAGSSASTFQFSDREVPHFPSISPVFQRETFWRWQSTDACSDLIIASVLQLFTSLLFAASGTPVECTKVVLEKFFKVMVELLRYRCWKNVTYESGIVTCCHAFSTSWVEMVRSPKTSWPSIAARPLRIEAYRKLASMLQCEYVGTLDQAKEEPVVVKDGSPKSVFHTVAWSSSSDMVYASFLHMYMLLQRNQPTYSKLRQAVRQGLSNEEIEKQYPAVLPDVLSALLKDVTTAGMLDELVEAFLDAEPLSEMANEKESEDRTKKRHVADNGGTLTDTAKRLRQENLARQLDDLTRPYTTLTATDHRHKQRRQDVLGDQKMEGKMLAGYKVAERRGLAFLVREYQQVLMRKFKENARERLVSSGSLPTTGDDVDLECRYEAMPLSPILLSAISGLSYASLFANSEAGKQTRTTLLTLLQKFGEDLVNGDPRCVSTDTKHSAHEAVLGASYLHLRQSGSLTVVSTISRRLRKKTTVEEQETVDANAVMFQILLTFALASWAEQTERWYSMPANPQRHLSMVCNMTPLTIRTMGLMVNHEHGLSSRSLFNHVCAICGRLLYSRSENSHLPREIGVAGPACQLRGRITDFFALPPFLLLWSKEALGRHLRSCLIYNNDKKSLTLRKRWEDAPWLHFKQHLMDVDDTNPWMYCTQCHDYYVPTEKNAEGPSDKVPKSTLRVPMRNRVEALYTRWHLDLGFVHMRDSLVRIFPRLKDQLPTAMEVLEFRKMRQTWIEYLRGSDPRSRRAQSNPVVEDLGKKLEEKELRWAPPPHVRADTDYTPIPESYFRAAAGGKGKWDLRRCHQVDLVPCEQLDLLQDMPSIPALQYIASCEARACISLCRPEGRYVKKRKLKGRRAPVVDTQPFHAGEFALRPLTGDQDVARGFATGVVASQEHLKEKFQITAKEATALITVLPELQRKNPWHAAYVSSLTHVDKIQDFIEQLKAEGCLAPLVPKDIKTNAGSEVQEELGEERTVLFIPQEIFEARGEYEKLRICADAICRARLSRPLPREWQEVCNGK